jgi:acyl-CoA thioesterase I
MQFNKNDKILIIGDSITDAWRRADPEQVGQGYFRMIRDYYLASYPELHLQFINKGVDGNRVTDLLERWHEDVLRLQPNLVSVMIGINDVWRQLDCPEMEQVYPDTFRDTYRKLLTSLKEQTNAEIVLMEPTVIEEKLDSTGNELLKEYVSIVNEVAGEFDAILVPTNKSFRQYLENDNVPRLTTDDVHLNSIGNTLLAKTWIKAVSEE